MGAESFVTQSSSPPLVTCCSTLSRGVGCLGVCHWIAFPVRLSASFLLVSHGHRSIPIEMATTRFLCISHWHLNPPRCFHSACQRLSSRKGPQHEDDRNWRWSKLKRPPPDPSFGAFWRAPCVSLSFSLQGRPPDSLRWASNWTNVKSYNRSVERNYIGTRQKKSNTRGEGATGQHRWSIGERSTAKTPSFSCSPALNTTFSLAPPFWMHK